MTSMATSFYSFDPAALLDGQAAPMVFGYAERRLPPRSQCWRGEPPRRAGEAVVGSETASHPRESVGDTVQLEALAGR